MSRRALVLGAGLAALASHSLPGAANLVTRRATFGPALAGLGDRRGVALTFDDGPDPSSTPAFLEALDRLGWKATFFMLGAMAEAAPGLASEVAAAGHEIALHGHLHRCHLLRGPRAVLEDVERGRDAVGQATGAVPAWHRPPYGAPSIGTVLAARRLGLRVVLWSTWGRDWRAQATPESVTEDLLARLEPGATLLLHDSDCTSSPGAWRSALGSLEILAGRLAAD
ncbi:MAG: polysaccharide deacetylase family protein, partial [Acidimicrobiales bacterium]